MYAPLVRQRAKSRRRTLQRFPHSPGALALGYSAAVRVFERDERINAVTDDCGPLVVPSDVPSFWQRARKERKRLEKTEAAALSVYESSLSLTSSSPSLSSLIISLST